MNTLLIVESPHKAKVVRILAKPFLEGTIHAWACLGHLRDLPEDTLGVDVDSGFVPEYIIPKKRTKTVASLREKILQTDTVLLASDPDREGEAVAWHVMQVFENELRNKTVQRVTFNAITAAAIQTALKHPRTLDMRLVTAAIARRVLDRLVGYFISPRLWKGLPNPRGASGTSHGLAYPGSAGRVQTAALRLLVEYEHARPAPQETWTVEVEL
jgi:DNA topoisomerase-1